MTTTVDAAPFLIAVNRYQEAKANSKKLHEEAARLDAEARALRERASDEVEQALLAFAKARQALQKTVGGVIEAWDSDRADTLLKEHERAEYKAKEAAIVAANKAAERENLVQMNGQKAGS